MEPLRRIEGTVVALPLANVDTDQLLPARYLKVARAEGLGDYLLRDLRFDADGTARADFPLNDPARAGARILIARRNFGGGSSREAAVYALIDSSIRCVIAPSFGDIFAANAANNGLLTAAVTDEDAERLIAMAGRVDHATVDLESCTITAGDLALPFAIDPVRRTKLLNGWDDLDLTLSYRAAIDAFAFADRTQRRWAVPVR